MTDVVLVGCSLTPNEVVPTTLSWSNFPYFRLDVKLGGAQFEVWHFLVPKFQLGGN